MAARFFDTLHFRTNPTHVYQEIAGVRSVVFQGTRAPFDQRPKTSGRPPRPLAVIQHDRQHFRQQPVLWKLSPPNQILIEMPGIGESSRGHVAFDGRLELEQKIEMDPFGAAAHAPHQVIRSRAQLVAHRVAAHSLQRCVMEPRQPVLAHKTLQQVAHHLWVREKELVTAIVMGHCAFRGCRSVG